MTFKEALEWQHLNAQEVVRLALLGDPLARRLTAAYRALYGDKFNPIKQDEWMAVVDDFIRRDLTLTERAVLQERFGHKIEPELRRLDS